MATLTGSQALVRSLVGEGVEVIFGLPGVQIMHIFDALHDEPNIRLVTARHEQGTTYMALGYARSTGKPGIALVVPGPGALNASAGLGTAYAVSAPVVLISGQMESYNLGKRKGALHEVDDQLDVFRTITKWCDRVLEVDQIPNAVHEALRQAVTGRPRTVELEIPWDILPKSADVELPEAEVYPKQSPDPSRAKEAAELLSKAKRPLIWAGGGAISADASAELMELATALNVPVMTTPEGKGIIPEDHPLSIGGFYSGHGPGYHAMPQADVILAVGSRLHLTPPVTWAFTEYQKLIQIDADADELGKSHPTEVAINADAKVGLGAILSELGGRTSSEWSRQDVDNIKAKTREDIKNMAPLQLEMIDAMRRELDDDAIVVAGITNTGYWSHLAFPVLKPNSYITSSYFATLGFAFPTAIGAKIGNPNKQVVALCGDGGFMFGIPDLATAVQEGANLVALVFNNSAFGASQADQLSRFKGRVYGTDVQNPDFVRMAESFGAAGIKVSDPSELGDALKSALKNNGPTVVEVVVPILDPPFQVPAHGMTSSPG